MNGTSGRSIFRRSGFVKKERDILQAEFILDGWQIGFRRAADNGHFPIRNPGTGFCFDGGGHGLRFLLTAVRAVIHDGRFFFLCRLLGQIGRVRKKQGKFRQCRGILVTQVLTQMFNMTGNPGALCHCHQPICHAAGAAEQSHAAIQFIQSVTAQCYRYIRRGKHCRNQCAL